jgi:uncharacterized protein YbjT (DUF2867 family)
MKILVTGGTGNLGRSISESLSVNGHEVKVASRSGNVVQDLANASGVVFDYEKPETYQAALNGVEGVLLMAPPMDPFSDKKLIPFMDAAKLAGVKNMVMISALGIDQAPESGLYKIEKHLEGLGLAHAIVRPNFFMDNFTTGFAAPMIEHQKAMYLSAGDGKTSFIATSDIAQAVSALFVNVQAHNGKAYNLTGTEAMDHAEVAKVLTRQLNEEISYVAISREDMKKGAMDNGMPEHMAEMMLGLYDATAAGYLAIVTNDYKELTGKEPVLFADFLN